MTPDAWVGLAGVLVTLVLFLVKQTSILSAVRTLVETGQQVQTEHAKQLRDHDGRLYQLEGEREERLSRLEQIIDRRKLHQQGDQ